MALPSLSTDRTKRRRFWGGLLLALLVAATVSCGNLRTGEAEIHGIAKFKMPAFPETGSNKVQIFTEMHYQPSYRSQEGPRLLPPPDSVPLTGREMVYAGEEFKDLDVPGEFQSSYDDGQAAHLFQVNCAVCHGVAMRGESMMATKMVEQKVGPVPADLMAELTREATDGEMFGFISKGGRQGQAQREATESSAQESCESYVGFLKSDCLAVERSLARPVSSPMPEFSRLLSEEERWWLVIYIQSQQ